MDVKAQARRVPQTPEGMLILVRYVLLVSLQDWLAIALARQETWGSSGKDR